jgi:hypothetical protein
MKNNTENTKTALKKALLLLPSDFALSEVREYILGALRKIESVEKKRNKRELNLQKSENYRTQVPIVNYNPINALKAIDEEISKEQQKIKSIQNRKILNNDQKDDDNEFQTVFG